MTTPEDLAKIQRAEEKKSNVEEKKSNVEEEKGEFDM